MPIQNTIASQLLSGAITAAAKASLMLPEECSPAIREASEVYAAVAHVAAELYDVPEGAFRQRVLLALAQESSARTGTLEPELGKCKWFALCTNDATHLKPHPILREVPCCDRCAQIGEEPRL